MIGNRKALQRRIVKLEEAIRMREKHSTRVHLLTIPGGWPLEHDTPEHAAAVADARAAYEAEHGPIGPYDTEVHVTFIEPDRTPPPKENTSHGAPAPHGTHEDAPGGEDHPAAPEQPAPPAPEPTNYSRAPKRDPYREYYNGLKNYF